MTFYPARVLLKFTSPRFQRLFSSSNNEGAGGQKPGSHMGTFDWDTTHINSDGFSSASNAKYMEFLYAKWIKDNKSIHESWQKFFSKLEDDQEKPEKNSSITKKSTSRKNLSPNILEKEFVDLINRK
nr:uncharacterized protein LOC108127507 [Drosophila bipectinata]